MGGGSEAQIKGSECKIHHPKYKINDKIHYIDGRGFVSDDTYTISGTGNHLRLKKGSKALNNVRQDRTMTTESYRKWKRNIEKNLRNSKRVGRKVWPNFLSSEAWVVDAYQQQQRGGGRGRQVRIRNAKFNRTEYINVSDLKSNNDYRDDKQDW